MTVFAISSPIHLDKRHSSPLPCIIIFLVSLATEQRMSGLSFDLTTDIMRRFSRQFLLAAIKQGAQGKTRTGLKTEPSFPLKTNTLAAEDAEEGILFVNR